jgi:uncharacterized repeat protein (TIGR03803 family)
MRRKEFLIRPTVLLAIIAVSTLTVATRAVAQQETLLHSFNDNGTDGFYPVAGLIFDAAGNLYGTTERGGSGTCPAEKYGCGTVFELSPASGGGWTETVLHGFSSTGTDGYYSEYFFSGSLLIDSSGNLYGTTPFGGTGACPSGATCGIVFELMPKAGGGWTEKILHNFIYNGKDGYSPSGVLVSDSAGNLYGTTANGGTYDAGTVFELLPKAGGSWGERVLHSFKNNNKDARYPSAGVIFDKAGNLYGASEGGLYDYGAVFELTPKAGGGWTEKVLHNFNNNGTDGYYPFYGSLILDAAGNLYGTTAAGGTGAGCGQLGPGCGTVFELSPKTSGVWTETILHNFTFNGTDGFEPLAGVIFDAAGNLYGTTVGGGTGTCYDGCGTVFKLTPAAGGNWTETVYSLGSSSADGAGLGCSLIFDASGNLYGTTPAGGAYESGYYGTVFEMTP